MKNTITTNLIFVGLFFLFATNSIAQEASQKLRAEDVFNYNKTIIFRDDFKNNFKKWELSIDANYDDNTRPTSSEFVQIVDAPDLSNTNATKFVVSGIPSSFRSELSLPYENGLQERWYSEKIYIDSLPTNKSGYIVMQWHALMGKAKVDKDFPNLAIWIIDNHWEIARAFGSPADIERDRQIVTDNAIARKWNKFVVHVKWSLYEDGLVQIWLNDSLVMDAKGKNIYDGLTDKSPYFKTGIYRPSRKHTTDSEPPTTVYATKIRIGNQNATYNDMAK